MADTAPVQLFTRQSIEDASAERLLALVSGASAIAFGLLTFALELTGAERASILGLRGFDAAVLSLSVTLVFGLLILYGSTRIDAHPRDWSVLVAAFSVVLLALGGTPGAIAGILGLFAAGVVLVREVQRARS